MRDHRMHIAGSWTNGTNARMEAVSPATGEIIGTVPEGSRRDVQRAIAAANEAWPDWAARSPFERAASMERIVELIMDRRDQLAHTLTIDQGKPLYTEAYGEVDELAEYFRMAGEDAKRIEGSMPASTDAGKRILVYRVPRGVVGVITPWNWPYTMPAELIAPALACGNAVVWAPAPATSLCAVELAQCIVDAGLPAGIFNMITGHGPVVGDEIAHNRGTQTVAFIGSIATGKRVSERAAGKALLLEMGGNGPVVILEDSEIDAAAKASLESAFLCAGQSCTAGERWLVHEAVHGAFMNELIAAIKQTVRLGDPTDRATTLGPLNNEATAQKMDRHVAQAQEGGAEVVIGGGRAAGFPTPLYYEPTVIDRVGHGMEVAREETFGPVVPVTSIRSESEALEVVNSSPYGLLVSVWTDDLARGVRFAEGAQAGWVNINESSNYWESHLPFGGRSGSQSGVGRVGGRHPMDVFTELKTVVVSLGT
ncbi:MAG: aldehyde dehydrogenase family protein [Actinomycetota bacterium]|nr:aldehyde dehydrogenase family protein [Actinomycetota bacterium]